MKKWKTPERVEIETLDIGREKAYPKDKHPQIRRICGALNHKARQNGEIGQFDVLFSLRTVDNYVIVRKNDVPN